MQFNEKTDELSVKRQEGKNLQAGTRKGEEDLVNFSHPNACPRPRDREDGGVPFPARDQDEGEVRKFLHQRLLYYQDSHLVVLTLKKPMRSVARAAAAVIPKI